MKSPDKKALSVWIILFALQLVDAQVKHLTSQSRQCHYSQQISSKCAAARARLYILAAQKIAG